MHLRKLLPILALLMTGGCASQGDLVSAQRDMDELKTRILRMEKETSSIGGDLKAGVDKSLKGLRGELETLQRNQADLQASLEGVRVDVQVLTGKLDDALNAAKKPADDLVLLKEDLDRRLTSFEGKTDTLGKELEELRKKVEAKLAAPPPTPDALYQSGLQALRGGDPAKGREMLQKFLAENPKHELAANAAYWIGESYYQEKKFEQAILEFQEMVKAYPGKEKVAAALLKQGMAFAELGDAKSARFVYRKITTDFPHSDEAKKAKEKLAELK